MQTQRFSFRPAILWLRAEKFRRRYQKARPFPHLVLDGFPLPQTLNQILSEFPKQQEIPWIHYQDRTQLKLQSYREKDLGPHARRLISDLQSVPFLTFLEILSGIKGLIPDPYLLGGGLHQIERGGFVKIHSDFNKHRHLRLFRRINLILYLNKKWKKSYGGNLELWDARMRKCVKSIAPIFNRCVIFNTTKFSFHGHPDPLNCPSHITRKSIALYYYSVEKPLSESGHFRRTLWQKRSGEKD